MKLMEAEGHVPPACRDEITERPLKRERLVPPRRARRTHEHRLRDLAAREHPYVRVGDAVKRIRRLQSVRAHHVYLEPPTLLHLRVEAWLERVELSALLALERRDARLTPREGESTRVTWGWNLAMADGTQRDRS